MINFKKIKIEAKLKNIKAFNPTEDYVLIKKVKRAEEYGMSLNEYDKFVANHYEAMMFSKNPTKQNIYEPEVFKVISPFFKKLTNLGNTDKILYEGNITKYDRSITYNNKTIDFEGITFGGIKVVISQKYTESKGGAQDNSYQDIRNFLKESVLCQNIICIAVLDGEYYNESILKKLRLEFDNKHIVICNSDNIQGELSLAEKSFQKR
jgi:hypothetical protein